METQVQKFKAEKVSNFEFKKTKDGIIEYDFEASTSVKIGNKVRAVDYSIVICAFRKDEKVGDIKRNTSGFYELIDYGAEIDWSEVDKDYEEQLIGAKIERNDQLIKKYTEEYKNLWIHGFVEKAKNAKADEVVVTPISEEDYVENCKGTGAGTILTMTYRGSTVGVKYTGTWNGLRTSNPNKFEYRDMDVTDHKTKWAKRPESLVDGFKRLVDEYYEKKENKKVSKKHEEARITKDLAYYALLFNKVEHKKEWVYSQYRHHYQVNRFYIIKGERRLRISKHNIPEENEVQLFNFTGIEKLTEKQVQSILEII